MNSESRLQRLTEEVVLSQRQQLVRNHQSVGGLQEPHGGAVQNGGAEETVFTHTPQHRSAAGVHHHPETDNKRRKLGQGQTR